MATTELIWTTAGWRTQHQIDVLNTISQLGDHELNILYTGLCDRLKRGDSSAGQVIRDLLNEPLLLEEVKEPLASAYKEACSPGDLPYGVSTLDGREACLIRVTF